MLLSLILLSLMLLSLMLLSLMLQAYASNNEIQAYVLERTKQVSTGANGSHGSTRL